VIRRRLPSLACLLLAGCSLVGARTFSFSFPAVESFGAVPVVLTDHSASVAGADEGPRDLAFLSDEGFMPVPDDPNAVVLHWLGGGCDAAVAIDIRDTGTLSFAVTTTVRQGLDCDGVGIQRSVLVQLSRPADPSRLDVRFGP
jgi:hypothetical protein